ncbi:hypothetical protein HZQ08_10225 [Elizabethkingia anophelis]|nr:hypothetical protein [Elizabethkingia anophelis]MCT4211875.1 hypothetical protein [Elizabethkingia anophelis]
MFILPVLLGRLAFTIVRKLKLDLKFSPLSFSNHWHYFFKGEIVHKTDNTAVDKSIVDFRSKKNNLSIVDILTLEGDKKYIYKGILLDYNLKDQNEDLDSIILYQPRKKNYDKDVDEAGNSCKTRSFEKIPGNFILIPYSSILNINIVIKPFDVEEKDINSLSKENDTIEEVKDQAQETTHKITKEEAANGCLAPILFLILIIVAGEYSKDISYIRFSIGLFFLLIFVSLLVILIDQLRKNFKFINLIYVLLTLLVYYCFYVYIFNINILNPFFILKSFIQNLFLKS